MRLYLLEGGSGADEELASLRVRLADLRQPPKAQHDLSVSGDAPADEPGVSALRHHGRPLLGTDPQHGGDLLRRGGPRNDARAAVPAPRRVDLVRRAKAGIDEGMIGPERRDQTLDEDIGQGPLVA